MFDDLTAYYQENVVSEFLDYRDISRDGVAGKSRDIRKALVSATALFHFREHIPQINRLSRSQVEKLCPDYALLGDIVNAAKHKSITQSTPHGAPLVNNAANLGERILLIEYQDEIGSYRYAQKIVFARLTDGTERNLLEVLNNVINFWEQHLHSLGVLSSPRLFEYKADICFRSRSECEANRLDLEMVQGQRFLLGMQFLRFNSETGKAEAIDLTGTEITFSMYRRPPIEIDLSLIHETSGKEFKKNITLTKDERKVVESLPNDVTRQAYINTLPATKLTMQQLVVEAKQWEKDNA